MSAQSLHLLVGRAIISEEFRRGILNGSQADFIRDLDLEAEDRASVLAIRADNLAEFAARVEEIAQRRERQVLLSRARLS